MTAQLDSLGLQYRLLVLLDTLVDFPLITLVEKHSDVTISKFGPDLEELPIRREIGPGTWQKGRLTQDMRTTVALATDQTILEGQQ